MYIVQALIFGNIFLERKEMENRRTCTLRHHWPLAADKYANWPFAQNSVADLGQSAEQKGTVRAKRENRELKGSVSMWKECDTWHKLPWHDQ